MTTTDVAAEPLCPRCSGPMWNQKAGKYPYKEGTPIFKCRDKVCGSTGGVIWGEPRGGAQPAPKPPVQYKANVPEAALPPLLRNAEAEDAADLAAKVGFDTTKIGKTLSLYQGLTEWYVDTIVPILNQGKDPVGCSPDSIARSVNTLFINVGGK